MNATDTSLLTRDRHATTRSPLVVVTDDSPVPEWVTTWCGQTGRRLRVRRVPQPHVSGPATPLARVQAVTEVADRLVLLVRPVRGRRRPPRVVAAVDALPDDSPVVATAAEIAQQRGAGLVLLHGVPLSFAERSVGLDSAVERGRELLETTVRHLHQAYPDVAAVAELHRAHPHELVGADLDADLLVAGGAYLGHPVRVGPVARSALHHAPCPVLLVPRHPRR